LDQPLQRHAHRIGKLGGGEARKQTEPSDNALKKHTALLCWQLASQKLQAALAAKYSGKRVLVGDCLQRPDALNVANGSAALVNPSTA
jgi:hypothetical protein